MRKSILVFLVCLLSVGVFAQKNWPKSGKKSTEKEKAKKGSTSTPSSTSATSTDYTRLPFYGGSVFVKDFPTAGNLFSLNTQNWKSPVSVGVSGHYGFGLSNHFDFVTSLGGTVSQYKVSKGDLPYRQFYYESVENPYGEQKLLLDASAIFNYKILSDKSNFTPYVSLGFTASIFNLYYFFPSLPIGGGVQYKINDKLFLHAQTLLLKSLKTEAKENFVYSLGLSYTFGRPKQKKQLPVVTVDTTKVVKVVDFDGDGIPDNQDKCPTVPGIMRYLGCPIPDTDKDNITDDQDSCLTVPGLARYHGCPIPDTDKDGINDEDDSCVTVPGLMKYKGCPIPDSDKDGVNDEEDKCPNEAGVVASKGCPDLIENKLKDIAKSINFAPGSNTISPKLFKSLDEVVAIMKKYPAFKLEIEGHTDNVGSPIANQRMSQKRVDALKRYFIGKGVDITRLYAVGYGLERPLASNKTAQGRAQNRRVELKVKF